MVMNQEHLLYATPADEIELLAEELAAAGDYTLIMSPSFNIVGFSS
jgi:hypothetical protein